MELVNSDTTYRAISEASRRFVESEHNAKLMADRHLEALHHVCLQ